MLKISDKINTGSTIDISGGGGQTINNEDLTITANGIYTASEGYTGIGTAIVNVPAGSDQKYGATINNFLGDVDVDGSIKQTEGNLNLVFNNVTKLSTTALIEKFFVDSGYNGGNSNLLKSVSFPDLITISANNALYKTFQGQTALESVSFPNLTTITSSQNAFTNTFTGCTNLKNISFPSLVNITGLYTAFSYCFQQCTNLETVSFPLLENCNAREGLRGLCYWCSKLKSIDFSKLNSLKNGFVLQNAFNGCTDLTSISFPALKSDSFGSYTNQFNNMLNGVTGCTVHFPSNLQAVIGSWSDVTGGFGGTNTICLFDLPATE